jgi:hypothetical protein
VASLLLFLTSAAGVHSACNATCERDTARCMATPCDGMGRETCRRRCEPTPVRTLAYVVSGCREDAAGIEVARQGLRIHRGDPEPISVFESPFSQPMPDSLQLCCQYGGSRWGAASVLALPLQRLGVSRDRRP